jgi:hypothetical protein
MNRKTRRNSAGQLKIANLQPACISKNKHISCKAAGFYPLVGGKKKTPPDSYREGVITSSKGSFGKQLVFQYQDWTDLIGLELDGFFNYWTLIAFKGSDRIFQEIGFALTVNDTKMLRHASISNYFTA